MRPSIPFWISTWGSRAEFVQRGNCLDSFTGSCKNCLSAEDTLNGIVKGTLMTMIPEIEDVMIDDGVSKELLDFARSLLGKS